MKYSTRLISIVTLFTFLWSVMVGSNPVISSVYAKDKDKPTPMALLDFRTLDSLLERQVRSYLGKALKKAKRLSVVNDQITAKATAGVVRDETSDTRTLLKKAQADFIRGKKLYENLSINQAIEALNEAVRGYREGIAGLRENRYLLVSHLYLGMALIIRGRESEGKEFIRQMIVLDPNRQATRLSRREYPPKIVNLYRALRKKVMEGPSGSVMMKTAPAGAKVYFDGVGQPAAPHEIRNVPAGEHFVVFDKKGYKRFSKRIVVAPGKNEVVADLEYWRPFAPYSYERQQDFGLHDQLAGIGKEVNAPLLLLGDMIFPKGNKLTLVAQIYDTRSKEFSKIMQVKTTKGRIKRGTDKLAQKILENVTVGGLVVAAIGQDRGKYSPPKESFSSTSKGMPPKKSGGSIWGKWWFWTILAGVVGGGAAAAVILTSGGEANSNILDIPNPVK